MPEETADDVGTYVKTWWNGISKGLDNTVLVGASVLAGDEEATKKSVKNWWEGIKKLILDSTETFNDINAPIMDPIIDLFSGAASKKQAQAVEKSAIETTGEDVLTLGRERRAIPLLDMLGTLAASGEWAGGISEATFDEWFSIVRRGGTSQEYMDVEAAIIKKYEELINSTGDKEPEKEDDKGNEALIETLNRNSATLEALNNTIAAMNKEDPTINLNVTVGGSMAALVSAVSSAIGRGARAMVIPSSVGTRVGN